MKKKIIIIITIALILIIGIVIFSLRHVILGHALKVTISKKTNETISLDIGHIDYDIFNSSVSFLGSELKFNNTFLNEDKTIELSELKFDQINIDNLSILRLLFKREVIADKFTIAKPSLWFMENNNPRRFKEKPKEIINSLKKHHDILKDLTIIVGEIEITHGKIDLKSLIHNQEHSGSVEFKLLLKEINTSKKRILEKDEILFAKEHFVKLSNFIYTLPNGDNISFDSVVFDSRLNKLITSNINVEIKSGSDHSKISPIKAQVAKIIVAGINFESLENLHDIDIDSIKISDVNLLLTDNSAVTANVAQDTPDRNNSILKEFNKLTLNSFILKNINILNNDHNGNTIINLNNLNFSVNNIKLDSASLANKIPDINYNSIAISTGLLKVIEKKSGLNIELNSLSFNEDKGLVSVSDIIINDLHKGKSSSITSNINAINISGVSVQDYVNCMPMKIGLDISNPIVYINLQKKEKHNSKKKKLKLDNIEITEINIENGNLYLLENNKMDISIPDFDFNSGIIKLTNFEKIHEVNTNNFILSGNSFEINLITENLLIKSGPLSVLHNAFTINDVTTQLINDKINASVSVQKLLFNGYSIKDIVNRQIISIHGFKIINPIIKGNLSIIEENKKQNKRPTNHHNYNINISDFEIINGDVDFDISMITDGIKIKSGVDITIGNINIAGGSDTTWLNKLMWNVNLTKPIIHYKDYLISCINIESDKANEVLVLNDINICDNLISKKNSAIGINDIHIKNVNISGLKYNTIFDKQTPQVNSITINNPYFDISIDNRINKPVITHGQLNKNSLPFDINDIEINKLSFNVETIDSASTSNISLHTLDLKYDMSVAKNMIDGVGYFDITNLTFTDTIRNSFAEITSIRYNQQNKNISISGVKGGSIYKQPDNENYTKFDLADLNISGIDITQTFPHEFDIDHIDIDGFNLNIENHTSKSKKKKENTKKKINLLKLISTLNINSVKGTNFNILHTSVSDTSDKKLSLNEIDFQINYIKIDSGTFYKNDYTFVKNISVNLNNNKFISKDSLYVTSVASVSYNFINNQLIIDTLLMKPRYKPAEFFKKAMYQTGKMDITTSKIICSDIRLDKLISNRDIHVGGVDVYGLKMFIFRNKKYDMNPNTYKKMPQESLLSANSTLTIDSLRTINSYIQYKQLSEKSVEPGIIFLDKVYLSIFNINNDLKVIDNTSVMTTNFKAQLLGESAVDLKMTFPILSPANDFWVTGHVSNVDFTKLNSMTQNLVGITLKKGTGELDIPLISGNSKHSQGSIAFKYKKLKIELYDRDKAQNAKGLGGNMANLLLNDILIKSNNPGFLGKTRTGEVYFKRNTQKSIVYYTWKSILSGIMSTMGYNNKEQRQEKKAIKLKMK